MKETHRGEGTPFVPLTESMDLTTVNSCPPIYTGLSNCRPTDRDTRHTEDAHAARRLARPAETKSQCSKQAQIIPITLPPSWGRLGCVSEYGDGETDEDATQPLQMRYISEVPLWGTAKVGK